MEKTPHAEPDLPLRFVNGEPAGDDEELLRETRALGEDILARTEGGGRYRFVKELARGGMGIIHVVEDQDLGRISAMKVIPPQIVDARKKLNAFVTEARITADLEHPNIVPVHEIGLLEDTGCPFYTMKKVEGESLVEVINRLADGDADYAKRFTRYRLLDIFRKVCDAVAYSHSRGVIHRDLKPENIMVGRFGEVLLMDWGLAKHIDAAETATTEAETPAAAPRDAMLTEDGMIKGSLAYISPEQVFGDISDVDEQTDIFLLGATLYHMFTHHPPYEGTDLMSIIDRAERCDFMPPNARNINAQIPKALERIILRAMAPVKANRFSSVETLIDEIDAYVAGRRVCDRRVFAVDEELITSGDVGTETYIVIRGSVAVHGVDLGRRICVATLGPGDIIGEMAGITHSTRSATVTALETTEVLVITSQLMKEELQKLPPWMEKIVFSMAERVRDLDSHVHPFLYAECVFPVVNQVCAIFARPDLPASAQGETCITIDTLLDELYLTIGLGIERTRPLLKIIVHSGLCRLTAQSSQELAVPDLHLLHEFVAYCRYHLEVKDGARRIAAMELPDAKERYFRGVLHKLQQAASP